MTNYKDIKIVFFGDSVTDTCKLLDPIYPFGGGYVNILKTEIHMIMQNSLPIIYNEGISGNKTEDLLNRIDYDVLEKNPDIVFLLIGINDIWHPFERGEIPNYHEILFRFRKLCSKITKTSRLIILTPFLFPTDEFFSSLVPCFDSLRKEMLQFIKDNNYEYIDIYDEMKKVALATSNKTVTKDSVHPTIIGHSIIAQCILNYLLK